MYPLLSSHPAAFQFQASTPPDNISEFCQREGWSVSFRFQTGLGATTHATLYTEQLISHQQVTLLHTFPLCQRLREMLYLCVCLKCMNYFTRFMAFWSGLFQESGTFSMYLTHLFNSVSRQHHEVWTSQFPFPHSLKKGIPPVSMTVLIGLWHRLILLDCLSPFLLKGVARSDYGLGFNSQYRRDLCWGLCQD